MNVLAADDRTIFLGQGMFGGTTMSETFDEIPTGKRIEMPVAEEMQTGLAVGMSLKGLIPVSVIPRWNFMLRAADSIVNHLDRLPLYSGYRPKVIIRTAVPSNRPFDPGPQHDDDFTEAFRKMLRTTDIVTLKHEDDIVPAYLAALESERPSIMVEYTHMYRNVRGGDEK
jgi:pyruvate/2-oxoglutarate/acetoin dehydrogenase E1 component